MNLSRHPFLDAPAPLAFAHRGGAADGSENTLAAFRRAVDLGYRYLETDVHLTADGRLVAFHDPTLDRVTDRGGHLARLPWSEVSRARLPNGEGVPLFEDLFLQLPGVRWNIDVKVAPALPVLLDLLRRYDAWDRVLVGGFDEALVARAQRESGARLATSLGRRGVLGLRLGSWGLPAGFRAEALAAQVPVRSGRLPVVDRRFIGAAHRAGLQVHVWTVNERSQMEELLDLGVDGIMTDRIELLREVLTERGVWGD
ncbi:glycerophosphodiester phosphodiesterase [Streptomyces sp. NPDC005438]|uniref:glycerophosphodiester phosphodiesterase n=1 Tax=Streptomyces sp. NPDC005438 TaxID=3156880 RepID=UPI0033A1CBB8